MGKGGEAGALTEYEYVPGASFFLEARKYELLFLTALINRDPFQKPEAPPNALKRYTYEPVLFWVLAWIPVYTRSDPTR